MKNINTLYNVRYQDVEGNKARRDFLEKDLKKLVKYCQELQEELSFCKDKVRTAEKIINDLKASG